MPSPISPTLGISGFLRVKTVTRSHLTAPQRHKHRDSCGDCDAAANRPPNLPGHEAAWQDADALQEPDAAEGDQDDAYDCQSNSHTLSCGDWVVGQPDPLPATEATYSPTSGQPFRDLVTGARDTIYLHRDKHTGL